MRVVGNGSIGEGNSALSIDAAALIGAVVSGDRHILDGYPSLRINAAPVAITCIPRGGRLVAGDRGVGDRNIAGVKVDIDAAAGAAAFFITGNRSTIHGKGRAGLIGAAIYTDLHAAGDRAAVQFKFAAVDGHFALNLSVAGAVGQRQRRAAADLDAAVDCLPVQAEVDLAFWHNPAARHRLRQIIAARRIGQGIGCLPCCVGVMGMTVDICSTSPIYFILECFKFFYSINLKKIICTFFRYITFICPHSCRHHTQTYRYSKQYTKYSFSHLV